MAGRNEDCPCGSRKKFKSCCLPKLRIANLQYRKNIDAICPDMPSAAKGWAALGLFHFYKKEYQNALISIKIALNLYNECAELWSTLGIILETLGEQVEAEVALKKSIAINPNLSVAWYNLGVLQEEMVNYTESIISLKKAIELNPRNFIALTSISHVATKVQNENALDYAKKATEYGPEYSPAWEALADIYVEKENYEEAIRNRRKAIEINPENPHCWYNLGRDLIHIKKPLEAIEAIKKTLGLDKDFENAWVLLGVAYEDLSDLKGAEEVFKQVLDRNPKNLDALGNLSGILFEQKKFKEALDLSEKARTINPQDPNLHLNCATILNHLEKYDEAEQVSKKAIEIDQNFTNAWVILAVSLQKKGDLDGSFKACQTALKLSSNSPDVLNDVGNVLGDLGKFNEAEETISRAIAINPLDYGYWNNLGFARIQAGDSKSKEEAFEDYKAARDAFEEAYRICPIRPDYVINIGLLSMRMGDFKKWKKFLFDGLALLDKNPPSAEELIIWTFSILHYLQDLPDLSFNELTPYFQKAFLSCIKFHKERMKNRTEYEMPSPLKMIIKWYGWQIAAIARNLKQQGIGTFPSEEFKELFKILFKSIEEYKEFSPDQALTCRTFWIFIQQILQLHQLNVTNARNQFARALQDFDYDLSHLALSDGPKHVFQELKDLLNNVNIILMKCDDADKFAQELEKVNEIVSRYIKACLDVEYPFPLLAIITKSTLEHELAFLRMRKTYLQMLPLESSLKKTPSMMLTLGNEIKPFRERILKGMLQSLPALEQDSAIRDHVKNQGRKILECYFRDHFGQFYLAMGITSQNKDFNTDIESPTKKGGESDIQISDKGCGEQVTISTKVWKRDFDKNPPIEQLLEDMGSLEHFGILIMINPGKNPILKKLIQELILNHPNIEKGTMKYESLPNSEQTILTATYNHQNQKKQVYFFIIDLLNMMKVEKS